MSADSGNLGLSLAAADKQVFDGSLPEIREGEMMKRDTNYISRLEPGDTFQNSRGETCRVTEIDKWGNITSGTVGPDSYLRIYDRNGEGSPASGDIETP